MDNNNNDAVLDHNMSEIVVDDGTPVSETPHTTENVNNGSNIEDLAKRYGWNPEGEKSAEEFVEFALKEVPDRGKELKRYKKTVDELKVHMQKQQDFAYRQALEDIKAQKQVAQDNGDFNSFVKLEQQEQQLQPVNPDIQNAWDDFSERNADWLDIDNADALDLRIWLSKRDNELAQKRLPPHDHFAQLEKDIKKKFASYFGETTSNKVQAVESDGYNSVATPKTNKKITLSQLSKAHQETAANYERLGIMTKEAYLADLIKFGDI